MLVMKNPGTPTGSSGKWSKPMVLLKIGELARQADCAVETIRLW
jgi:hypothetical protein